MCGRGNEQHTFAFLAVSLAGSINGAVRLIRIKSVQSIKAGVAYRYIEHVRADFCHGIPKVETVIGSKEVRKVDIFWEEVVYQLATKEQEEEISRKIRVEI